MAADRGLCASHAIVIPCRIPHQRLSAALRNRRKSLSSKVHPGGFEPPTPGSEDRYSIQLNYGCVCVTTVTRRAASYRIRIAESTTPAMSTFQDALPGAGCPARDLFDVFQKLAGCKAGEHGEVLVARLDERGWSV